MARTAKTTVTMHDKWCEEQHEKVNGNINKMYTRLGKIETILSTHSNCAEEVRKELKCLNKWAQKRDGATTALMWVAGVTGTVIMLGTLVYKLSG